MNKKTKKIIIFLFKVFWDVMIQCDKEIQARRPDIAVVDKCRREVRFVDIAIPGHRIPYFLD